MKFVPIDLQVDVLPVLGGLETLATSWELADGKPRLSQGFAAEERVSRPVQSRLQAIHDRQECILCIAQYIPRGLFSFRIHLFFRLFLIVKVYSDGDCLHCRGPRLYLV